MYTVSALTTICIKIHLKSLKNYSFFKFLPIWYRCTRCTFICLGFKYTKLKKNYFHSYKFEHMHDLNNCIILSFILRIINIKPNVHFKHQKGTIIPNKLFLQLPVMKSLNFVFIISIWYQSIQCTRRILMTYRFRGVNFRS